MEMIGSVLDRMGKMFGRVFMVVGVIPVGLFSALSLGMICWIYPSLWRQIVATYDQKTLDLVLIGLATVLVLIASSFIVLSLNSAFRQIMEGKIFGPITRFLRSRSQLLKFENLSAAEAELEQELHRFQAVSGADGWKPMLVHARAIREVRNSLRMARRVGEMQDGDARSGVELALHEVEEWIDAQTRCISIGAAVDFGAMQQQQEHLVRELKRMSARGTPMLAGIYNKFLALLGRSGDQLRREAARLAHRPLLQAVASDVLVAAIKEHIKELERCRRRRRPLAFDAMAAVHVMLVDVWLSKMTEPTAVLDGVVRQFGALFDYAATKSEIDMKRIRSVRRQEFPARVADLCFTKLGNIGEAHRDYAFRRYGFDIELLWFRLVKFVRSDSNMAPLVDEAKLQLDFSVAMTWKLFLFTALWTPLSFVANHDPYCFLLVGVLGGCGVSVSYRATLQSYRAFTEAVRSAVDLHRFELLQALHITLPQNSLEERRLWNALMTVLLVPDSEVPVVYDHTWADTAPSGAAAHGNDEADEH